MRATMNASGDVDEARRSARAFVVVALAGSLALVAVSLSPWVSVAKYRRSWMFLVPLVALAFLARRALALNTALFAAFVALLLVHDLGAFGGYSWTFGVLQFDWCVHFLYGALGAVIAARALARHATLRGGALALLCVLAVGGIGALHEIMEAGTTMFLGDEGMLYVGADNPYDTQEDLLAAAVGSTLAALGAWANEHRSKRATGA